MELGRIFVLLVLFASTFLVYARSDSFWGHRVFPDDAEWLPPHKRKHQSHLEHEKVEKDYKVCETQHCKKIAEEFFSSINKSVDPCEDFYDFTCGGWSKDVIPPNSPVWSRFMIFQNTVKHRIKGVLETPPEPSDILPVRQAKKWYHSCMNADNLERRGLTPIESILMQVGGWPIIMDEEEWDSKEYTWQNVDRHYAKLTGSYALYNIIPVRRSKNTDFGMLVIMPQKLTLSEMLPLSYRNYSGNDYDAYVRLVEGAAELFVQHNLADVSKEKLKKEAKEIVEFEKALFELENDGYVSYGFLFEELPGWIENNTEVYTDPKAAFDLTAAIKELFATVNSEVDPQTEVLITNAEYVNGLGELLSKTPARTIVNYIHWTFVGNMLVYTTEKVRNELLAFIWQEYGVKERFPRWYECVNDMKMDHAAAFVFVDKYFTKTTKNAALEMIKTIEAEMHEKIEKSGWLDEEAKATAIDKLNAMRIFVGFPSWYKNKTAVLNYYKGITVGADYFDNMLSYTRYEKKAELKKYLRVEDEDEPWYIDPITVNAIYSPNENMLNLPAVDFQAPLFTPQIPHSVNYGIAGVIVGHEIGHGFDDSGIQYGKDGNETELSEKILKSYYQKADCFTDQFEEYYRESGESNSEGVTPKVESLAERKSIRTRGENIADTTGIQAVFQAYKKLNKEGSSTRLPGLEEFNEDQLFFLSFAATWCQIATPQYEAKSKKSYDVHSPAKLRVIGSVSNTKDFAKVFNCPKGSAMNPINKCNIWEESESTKKAKASVLRREDLPWETQWKI